MSKRKVLDVGNCGPDHAAIRQLLTDSFGAVVLQTHGLQDTLDQLRSAKFDLVLINRKLDHDYSDGVEILKQIKAEKEIASTPVMIVTNYEDQQELAILAGAVRGFGKLELKSPATHQRLAAFLS